MDPKKSTYFFIAQLGPAEECQRFWPGELDIGNGWVLDIHTEMMCLWNPRVSEDFPKTRLFVGEALTLLTALYTARSGKFVYARLRNWVECKDCQSMRNVVGLVVKRNPHASPNSRANVSWKRAAKFFPRIRADVFMRQALKDYVSALNDSGDDAFFYAYRAVEAVCRSVSSPKNELQASDWRRMHAALGTSKSTIDPLTNVAKEIRHGNVTGKALAKARKSRTVVLTIARKVIAKALMKRYRGFL